MVYLKQWPSKSYLAIYSGCWKHMPNASEMDLTVDRAHWLPKPLFLHANIARDTLARINFYNVKEMVLSLSRKLQSLPDPYGSVTIYSDLSAHTMKTRKDLGPITEILQEHKIPYKWVHPTKLLLTRQGKLEQITSLEEGWSKLKIWQLFPPTSDSPVHRHHPTHFQMKWSHEAGPSHPT